MFTISVRETEKKRPDCSGRSNDSYMTVDC